jgi:hypothetical protein
MSRILPAKEILDIQIAAFAGIQRTDAIVYFGTKSISARSAVKQLAADLLLIGVWQARKLCNGLFKRFDHAGNLAHFDS